MNYLALKIQFNLQEIFVQIANECCPHYKLNFRLSTPLTCSPDLLSIPAPNTQSYARYVTLNVFLHIYRPNTESCRPYNILMQISASLLLMK